MRTYIYIDGFNFYYRAVRNTPHKWLDLKSMCQKLLPIEYDIKAIKYYTAFVSGKRDPDQPVRQMRYLSALRKHIPEFSYIAGKFLTNKKWLPKADNPDEYVEIIKTEEKGSDVNLAVHMLIDAWEDKYDAAVIVSNDSDFVEAINITRNRIGKEVWVFTPGERTRPSRELCELANHQRIIRGGVLRSSQLPNPIPGTSICKPESW